MLRLHSWYATKEQKDFLKSNGIKVLFMPNDCVGFVDNRKDFFEDRIKYIRTDLRVENMSSFEENDLLIGNDFVVIFTHEWCFVELECRVRNAVKIYSENGYEFI